MKLRVHDDIGHSILAARRTLLRQVDLEEIRASAALWDSFYLSALWLQSDGQASLPRSLQPSEQAAEMGVDVLLNGPHPQLTETLRVGRTGNPRMCNQLRPSCWMAQNCM